VEPITMFIGDGFQDFREKNPNGNVDSDVSMTCYTPQHCMMHLAGAQFHRNFPLFRCVESFFRRSQMPSRPFSV